MAWFSVGPWPHTVDPSSMGLPCAWPVSVCHINMIKDKRKKYLKLAYQQLKQLKLVNNSWCNCYKETGQHLALNGSQFQTFVKNHALLKHKILGSLMHMSFFGRCIGGTCLIWLWSDMCSVQTRMKLLLLLHMSWGIGNLIIHSIHS